MRHPGSLERAHNATRNTSCEPRPLQLAPSRPHQSIPTDSLALVPPRTCPRAHDVRLRRVFAVAVSHRQCGRDAKRLNKHHPLCACGACFCARVTPTAAREANTSERTKTKTVCQPPALACWTPPRHERCLVDTASLLCHSRRTAAPGMCHSPRAHRERSASPRTCAQTCARSVCRCRATKFCARIVLNPARRRRVAHTATPSRRLLSRPSSASFSPHPRWRPTPGP